jgi:hypothetical protein
MKRLPRDQDEALLMPEAPLHPAIGQGQSAAFREIYHVVAIVSQPFWGSGGEGGPSQLSAARLVRHLAEASGVSQEIMQQGYEPSRLSAKGQGGEGDHSSQPQGPSLKPAPCAKHRHQSLNASLGSQVRPQERLPSNRVAGVLALQAARRG